MASNVDSRETLYLEGLVPLVIGVTGHRDLVVGEIPDIRRRVHAFFQQLRKRFPDRPLQVVSSLAEGSDRLVAEVALELGLRLIVPLPMSLDLYVTDFTTEESRQQFDRLCRSADAVYELPIVQGSTVDAIHSPGEDRDRQYARVGVFISTHCHVLLALWDGKPSEKTGGTAHVVRFHHDDVMPGFAQTEVLSRQLLVDDQSDLVYHIAVSRDRPGGAPLDGFDRLGCCWSTTNDVNPRTAELPDSYARMFERTSVFNRDARAHWRRIEAECYPLMDDRSAADLPAGIETVNRLFCAADWLAINFQRRMLSALRLTHSLVFLMGMVFIFYANIDSRRLLMLVFFVCFAVALAIQRTASRRDWHGKYLEYRALAEGLRVQFYWAAAGVTSEPATKYSHDSFLQKQDVDLGWIRNVMRVAGIACNVSPHLAPQGLAFVLREWIGDDASHGQLGYYRRNMTKYVLGSLQIRRLGQLIGAVVMAFLLASVIVPSDELRTALFVALAALLLLFGLRESYAFRVAEKELVKQYYFMLRIFTNARRRLDAARSDDDRRQLLRILGEAALDEHGEWILKHRERPLDQTGLWLMRS
jgi:hypothetical protein